MDYTLNLNMIMAPNLMNIKFDYSGDNNEFFIQIGFKRSHGGTSDIKFIVLRNNEPAGIKETKMTEKEKFVNIPFMARRGDVVSCEVMNCTDATDIVITHTSISSM